MNDEEFEDKLRVLAARLARRDPTAAWKADILGQARSGASVRSPRWLALGLGFAWACIAVLRITTPDTTSLNGTPARAPEALADFRHASDTPLQALIALHTNPQFPDVP
jgi:hypothetical protein